MYLVSVGVECVCVKGSLVLVLVLDWTQCFPQGVGAPPAMLPGRTAGFPPKTGWLPPGEAGLVDTICTVPPTWHINHEQAVSVLCSLVTSCSMSVCLIYIPPLYCILAFTYHISSSSQTILSVSTLLQKCHTVC